MLVIDRCVTQNFAKIDTLNQCEKFCFGKMHAAGGAPNKLIRLKRFTTEVFKVSPYSFWKPWGSGCKDQRPEYRWASFVLFGGKIA